MEPSKPIERLSQRERHIAGLYAQGLTYKAVAKHLNIAPATVRTHIFSIYRKLDVSDKGALATLLAADITTSSEMISPAELNESTLAQQHNTRTERRQLTVMHCELIYPAMASQPVDAEILHLRVNEWRLLCRDIVERYEGSVARKMGSGALICFGYPAAHEDDAERALRAGLDMLQAVSTLNNSAEIEFQVQIGIATGQVIIDSTAEENQIQSWDIIGNAPNLVTRLMAAANPGSILVSRQTAELVNGAFQLSKRISFQLEGFDTPVDAHKVIAVSNLESRFEALRGNHQRQPMVGRDEELALLLRCWQSAVQGEGQIAIVSGEAGIGKSRIIYALLQALSDQQYYRIFYQCSPYHTDSALYPAIQQLARVAHFAPGDDDETRLDKLEALLSETLNESKESAPLIAALLNIDGAARYGKLNLSPQQLRTRTLRTLIDTLRALAQRQPVLFIIEDAHWIDPTTRELIELSVDIIREANVLLLISARPPFDHRFYSHPSLTQIMLNHLNRNDNLTIIKRISGGRVLPQELLDEIVRKTDGVPLFAEELTKTVLESGQLREAESSYSINTPLRTIDIPSSLHDSLLARLDRLPEIKTIAQAAACIGREFSQPLLAVIADLSEQQLQSGLNTLVEAGLVLRRGWPSQIEYRFKHALVRDAAYNSLLRNPRQVFHTRIAQTLPEFYSELTQKQPELLAHHYTQAGLPETALDYWEKACQQATRRSAYHEALEHTNKMLALLTDLPVNVANKRRSIIAHTHRGAVLMAIQGWTSKEAITAYQTAHRLCSEVGNPPEIFPVLRGIWTYYYVLPDLRRAHTIAGDWLKLAEEAEDPVAKAWAHCRLGQTYCFRGELKLAQKHFQQALDLFDPDNPEAYQVTGALALNSCASAYLGQVFCLLGHPKQALQIAHDTIKAVRQENAGAFNLEHALGQTTHTLHWLRYHENERELINERLQLSQEHGLTRIIAGTKIARDRMLLLNPSAYSADDCRQIVQAACTFNWVFYSALAAAQAAVALARLGEHAEALSIIKQTLVKIRQADALNCEAEILRLKGEILQYAQQPVNTIEACFHESLAVARHRSAKWWELRTATSLARFWCDQNKLQQAYDLLAPVYEWFSEGFDTADLTDARALLDELSEGYTFDDLQTR